MTDEEYARIKQMIGEDVLFGSALLVHKELLKAYCDGVADGLRLSVKININSDEELEVVCNRILNGFERMASK